MGQSVSGSRLRGVLGGLMLVVGLSVFLIRLHHAGPYAFPRGGNLLSGILALGIGLWLSRSWLREGRMARALGIAAVAASPVVLFFALYATLAELEEVIVLKPTDGAGHATDLRLWVVDRADGTWVTMPIRKAERYGLVGRPVQMLRGGNLRCVVSERYDDRETVNGVHRARHEKYAVQRIATAIGLFGETAGEDTITLRLGDCPKIGTEGE